MLPKVNRDAFLLDGVGVSDTNSKHLTRLRMMSAFPGNKGRRTLLSKSARLTAIPMNANFAYPAAPPEVPPAPLNSLKPYLSTSYTSSLAARQNRLHQDNISMKWKMGPTAPNKSGYSNFYPQRTRAQSHKPEKFGTSSGTEHEPKKPIPYLVPKRVSSSKPGVRKDNGVSPDRALDSKGNKDEKTVKASPSPSTQLGGMIMLGTGKSSNASNGSSSVSLMGSKVPCALERFQVIRSQEEKEKHPDTIRIDKKGIRIFPDIGGGETATLKLLSLQHNLISRLENVPLLPQLVVLDLYDNRVERICGLHGLPLLRVLLLGKNRIKRIEGLDAQKKLEILDLHGNQLRYVDNLGSLTALRVLNLAGNLLRNIRNLGPHGLSSLMELNLKRNRIKNLEGLQKATHLKRLLVANNDLQNIAALAPLRKLTLLHELVIEPNPLNTAAGAEYKNQVVTLFPNLNMLDRSPVTDEMRTEAKAWHKIKLAEEEARRVEEERIRLEMATVVGPPGSREQVIYQARQRWESLKNFVKNPDRKMKTMSDVVTSVKAKKPSPFDELYPPATLDLESFPDGIAELDQMESLLSIECKSKSENEGEDTSEIEFETDGVVNHEEVEETDIHEDGPVPAIKIESASSNDTSKSQDAPDTPQNSHIESDTVARVQTEQHQSKESNLGVMDGTENKLEAAMKTIPEHYALTNYIPEIDESSPKLTGMLVTLEKSEVNEDSMDSARSINFRSLSSPNAKVAVVRPFRTSSVLSCKDTENESPHYQVSNITNESSPTAFAEIPPPFVSIQSVSATELEAQIELSKEIPVPTSQATQNSGMSSKVLPDHHDTVKFIESDISEKVNGLDERDTSFCDNSNREEVDLIMHEDICTEHREKTDLREAARNSSLIPKIEENKRTLATALLASSESVQTHNQQIATIATKSKLLKQLRSMSLDSAFPPSASSSPILSSQVHKLDNSNSPPFLPSDENDEEDNDNEVQDYDCDTDYAYSIATSTATTVTGTSMGTPRRSSTVIATTNRLLKSGSFRKQTFPRTRSQRIKIRDRAAKLLGSPTDVSPRPSTTTGKRTLASIGARTGDSITTAGNNVLTIRPPPNGRVLRRCDSAASLTTFTSSSTTASSTSSTLVPTNPNKAPCSTISTIGNVATGPEVESEGVIPYRKQGVDFLVEIEGKNLNVFGQGGLRHALTAFTSNVTCHVNTAKFHYISYDSIIPFFGKLRQVYPSLEHFHFRANNLSTLAQLDALSDLQGLSSLCIAKEGNPIVTHQAWFYYASYRLSHWGLHAINGKEVCSEYRGGVTPAAQAKGFESLGFLALSCLPQTALTPLAKRLHMLHCFCCCSPSTSSDESSRPVKHSAVHHHNHGRIRSPTSHTDHNSSGNFCTEWDDDPVLLDVIGKEALVYCPPTIPVENETGPVSKEADKEQRDEVGATVSITQSNATLAFAFEKKRSETLEHLIDSGVEIVEKVDRLEKIWPTLMTEVIQEFLMDFRSMDSYMKKELKKTQDISLISNQHQCSIGKKHRH